MIYIPLIHVAVAHKEAWEKAEILHRDISCGNILIDDNKEGFGFLNDWDLCKSKDIKEATQANRSVGCPCFCEIPCSLFTDL